MDDDPPGPLSVGVPRAAEIMRERAVAESKKAAEAGIELLAEAAKEEGAVQTDSGLVVNNLVVGEGKSPTAESTVKVAISTCRHHACAKPCTHCHACAMLPHRREGALRGHTERRQRIRLVEAR